MALSRSKSLKAKKYGTPTPTTPSPKAPSPRQTGGTPTPTRPQTVTKPPAGERKVIPQSAAGIAVQEQFKQQLQNNPIVRAATETIRNLQAQFSQRDWARMSDVEKIPHQQVLQKEHDKIEAEKNRLIEVELAEM